MMNLRQLALLLVPACATLCLAQSIPLPTSKQILPPVPGSPQQMNSLPMHAAWSPDHRWLALINAGYGTAESSYQQSIAVLDASTGKLTDNPDARTLVNAPQTMYSGVAFSTDGRHLYASFDSLSSPNGGDAGHTGNAIAVYGFSDGVLTPERLIPIPLQHLEAGRTQKHGADQMGTDTAIPVPTGLAVLKDDSGAEKILVADEFSDDVLLVDAASGKIDKRFDLARGPVVPSEYPIAVLAARDGRHAYVALWNGSAVAELDLRTGKVAGRIALMPPAHDVDPSSHPVDMVFSPDEKHIYVALANRDAVAAIRLDGETMRLAGIFDTRLPGQTFFGAMPDAVAVSPDGRMLYAANSGSDAVAVFHVPVDLAVKKPVFAEGFIPTEWYPTAVAVNGDHLYVATAKSRSTGPNAAPQPPPAHPVAGHSDRLHRPHTYIATLLHGSLASIDLSAAEGDLKELTRQTVASNMMNAAQKHIEFESGGHPIHHVIYIIKENRTYDQIFGDLKEGDGDASLTMYGRDMTPNLHKLAEQFGVLDNFYDSGEVSGDGHVWSTAAITSDYTERDWQQAYRGRERTYDFEGVVENGYPLLEHIPDIDEPASGYLWTDLARHGKSLYHFGEFISTKFCDDSGEAPKTPSPLQGTPEPTHFCPHPFIHTGEAIPANYGGGVSKYPWPIPLIYKNVATKPELEGHFDPQYPDFNLSFPDQLRVNEFLSYFRRWVADRQEGHDTMPAFVMLRLPNDHTAGTRPGSPTPEASVSDNDLAVGRAVDAISHSAYWDDTAFFVLEDDAQAGADHVDAHRSIALVISKYSPRAEQPVVDHHFYTTVSVLRTMEDLLGVPPMNNNDAFAPLIAPLFGGAGNQPAFDADYRNRDNGLIYTANTPRSPGAKESSRMDFTHEDRAPTQKLNVILWKDAMGDKPVPAMLLHPADRGSKDRDDDD
ncbi:beta-propeller fold lactonase family protein [Paracidobacterium acidisoli]|nr:beta-propeller fold lactonase family protein [Paracidobacterium acidisoli]